MLTEEEPKSSEITDSDNSPATNRVSHCRDFGRTKFIRVMHKESDRSLAEIEGSNPAGSMDICLCECCVSGRGLCVGLITRPEETYRMWYVWVWSWKLDNEEALAHWGLLYCEKHTIDSIINNPCNCTYTLTLLNNQLDTQLFYIIIRLLQSSKCFEQRRAHHQEVKLY